MAAFRVIFLPPRLLPSSFPAFSPFPPPSSCLAGTWHGRIRSPLKAGTLGKHPRPPTPQPRGAKGVPRFPARWPCFPAAAHPAGLDPALLLLRLLPRSFAAVPSTRTQRLKIAARSRRGMLRHQSSAGTADTPFPTPNPRRKPPPNPRPTPRGAAAYGEVGSELGTKGLDPPGSPGSSQGGE